MANPLAESYVAASGSNVYCGMFAPVIAPTVPTWVTSQAIGTWGIVPTTNFLTDALIDPEKDATVNPNGTTNAPWRGNGVFLGLFAYSGGVIDPYGSRLFIGPQGGHADYGANCSWGLDYTLETPTWVRRSTPSGSIDKPITDGGLYAPGAPNAAAILAGSLIGTYSDGRPRPIHTYAGMAYIKNRGVAVTNSYYCFPNLGGPSKAWLFNTNTNEHELLSDYTALGNVNAARSGSCYDELRDVVWTLGEGVMPVLKQNPTTKITTVHGAVDNWAQEPRIFYWIAEDLIVCTSRSAAPGWRDYPTRFSIFDPKTSTWYHPPVSGSLPAGVIVDSRDGTAWDEIGSRLILWAGSSQSDRTLLGTLTRPTGNPRTDTWTLGALPISPNNSVVPTAPTPSATYGRFDVVPDLGIVTVLNSPGERPYFFRIR